MGPPIFCCGLLFPPVVKDLNHSEHFILSEQESQAGPSPLDARMSYLHGLLSQWCHLLNATQTGHHMQFSVDFHSCLDTSRQSVETSP